MGPQPNDRQAFVYAYDAHGNRVNLNWPGPPGPNTQGMDYTYDHEGRLIGAQAYQTNGRGHRVEREMTRLFYDGLGRRLVKEYDPRVGAGLAPAQGGVKRTEYVFDNLDPVVEYALWNGQREEFYWGAVEAFSPTPMLLARRHFPAGALPRRRPHLPPAPRPRRRSHPPCSPGPRRRRPRWQRQWLRIVRLLQRLQGGSMNALA